MIFKKVNQSILFSFSLVIILYLTSCAVVPKNYNAGDSYLNDTEFVEYLPGTLPLVISVPHGGYLMPKDIENRDCKGCVYVRDSYTQELARSIRQNFFKETGFYPHVIINLLHRKKFDANRDKEEASDGNPIIEKAWADYHQFIDIAKAKINKDYKTGLFIDLHGHAHKVQRIELGYLLGKKELQLPNVLLNTDEYINKSSIKKLINNNPQHLSHTELLKGDNSLGTLLEQNGAFAVPSSSNPFPTRKEKYFKGGYNTVRHGSLNGGNIDGIQMECNSKIRFNATKKKQFASNFVTSVSKYIEVNYSINIIK